MSESVPTFGSDQFSAESVVPFEFGSEERRAIALREAAETIFMEGVGSQRFSGLHLNRDFSGNIPIIRIGSFKSASDTAQQKYTAYQFAAANPEHPYIAIDLPSHGRSDRFTARQYAEMVLSKTYMSIAGSHAQAIRSSFPEQSEAIMVGDSIAAQILPDFVIKAGEIGLKTTLMIGFEMAGVNKYAFRRTALKQVISSNASGHQKYHEGAANTRLDQSYQDFTARLRKITDGVTEYDSAALRRRDPLLIAIMFARSPTSGTSGLRQLNRALTENPDLRAAVVTGGRSKISNWSKIGQEVNEMERSFDGRLSWSVWPNDGHAMNIAEQQPRAAAFTQQQIENLVRIK